jgi:hypothetical protein
MKSMGVFLVGGLLGLGLFLFGFLQYRKVRRSQSWPSVPGTVTGTSVRRDETRDEDGIDVTYVPVVEYQFAVGETWFRGNRLRFDDRGFGSPKTAQKALAGFPVGTPVAVFYNPHKPSQCVLERKQTGGWVVMAVGILFLLATIVAAVKK